MKLKFCYKKNKSHKRASQNALQCSYSANFDYACHAWYPNLNKKTKKKIQMQSKCISFSLKLDKMHPISEKDDRLRN